MTDKKLAEVSSPATPQVSNYVTESAARFKKFFVPVTYESLDGDTLAVRMCKKIYNLTALAKFHDTPIGPDELRTINSAAFAGLEGEDEITEGAASPSTPERYSPSTSMAGPPRMTPDDEGDYVLLADVARLPASQEEK